jgi:hypothetical protein
MSEEIVTDDTEAVDDTATETETLEGEEALGDPGKKALDLMKAQRNAATKEARDAKAELERLRQEAALKDKPAEEQALEAARQEARLEANQRANERILRSELRASATGKLADPSDAALYINLSDFDVSDDGEIDSDALRDAIDDLLTRKPHLAATTRRFDGNADQGPRGERKPSQLTDADLSRMTPAQINQARREGRLDRLMGTTH